MGHQTATTTYPYTPNERSSDSFRHTPIPREDETAVTGSFTARRTRGFRARRAHVSCGGAPSWSVREEDCSGGVEEQCGEQRSEGSGNTASTSSTRLGRLGRRSAEGMGRRPRRRGAHARRRGHARRGMSGDRGTGIPSYPARGSPRGCESIPPYRTLRCPIHTPHSRERELF
jgi:hypothetical protein